jgi:predicted Zn-dependent protease
MTFVLEKALGLEAAPKMAQQMGGVLDPRQDPDARIVAEVGHKLVNSTEASKSPYVGNFNFYLLDDPKTINAFALPGGQIFITRALYSRLQDESQLAGVLGHEVGHVIHRHSAQQMAKGQLGQMLVVATGVGASDDRGHGQMAAAAAAMANQMMQLKYGRGDESQSDSYGLKLMAQAGYDPRGMLAVMEVLKAAGGGGRQPEFLSSHPLPDNRLEEIKQIIARDYPNGVPDTLTRGRELGGCAGLVGDRQGAV